MTETLKKILRCRRCGEAFPSLKDLSAHVLAAHAEERRAAATRAIAQRRADRENIDRALAAESPAGAERARPENKPRAARADTAARPEPDPASGGNGNGHVCPLCGGIVPHTTAALVAELTRAGLAEHQAFEAAKIARRVFAAPAAA